MKKMLLLSLLIGFQAHAGLIEKVATANCTNETGSFLSINTTSRIIQGRINDLPNLINISLDYKIMGLQVKRLDGWTMLGGFTLNSKYNTAGNLMLVSQTGQDLAPQSRLNVLFVDQSGQSQTEELNCSLSFEK